MTAFLILAALQCVQGDLTTLAIPSNCLVGTVRQESLPGAVPYSNAWRRLDRHAEAACLGTLDAYYQRMLLPGLLDYGGARGKKPEDVAASDLFAVTNSQGRYSLGLLSKMWYTQCFLASYMPWTIAAKRDYAGMRDRIVRLQPDLDTLVFGIGAKAEGTLRDLGLNPRVIKWLHPGVDHGLALSSAKSGWSKDDQLATADWSRLFLTLGEFGDGYLPPLRPFRSGNGTGFEWAAPSAYGIEQYMSEAKFRTVGDLAAPRDGADMTARARAFGGTTNIVGLLAARGAPTNGMATAVGQSSRRFSWDKFATANALLSLCERTIEFAHDGFDFYLYDATNDSYTISGSPIPAVNFEKIRTEVTVDRSKAMKLRDGVKIDFSSEDPLSKPFYYRFSEEDWEETASPTSGVTVVQRRGETVHNDGIVVGWEDVEGFLYRNVSLLRPIRASDFGDRNPNLAPGDYRAVMEMDGPWPACIHLVDGYNGVFERAMRPTADFGTGWSGNAVAVAHRRAEGHDSSGKWFDAVGPTVLDDPLGMDEIIRGIANGVAVTNSCNGYAISPLAATAIDDISVAMFGTCVISTNDDARATASATAQAFTPGDGDDKDGDGRPAKKSGWAFFKLLNCGSIGKATSDDGSVSDRVLSKMADAYSTWEHDIMSCYAASGVGDSGAPTPLMSRFDFAGATMADLDMQLRGVPVFVSGPGVQTRDLDVIVRILPGGGYTFLTSGNGWQAEEDAEIARLEVAENSSGDLPRKRSAAAEIAFRPALVTTWKFDQMSYKEDEK